MTGTHIATARRVIAEEAAALAALSDMLGNSFDAAVDTILSPVAA
jgi:hypothetical protein